MSCRRPSARRALPAEIRRALQTEAAAIREKLPKEAARW